eukprot:356000-Chlamydomonas_euryale.AAC.5
MTCKSEWPHMTLRGRAAEPPMTGPRMGCKASATEHASVPSPHSIPATRRSVRTPTSVTCKRHPRTTPHT